jgi:hypothetical protein
MTENTAPAALDDVPLLADEQVGEPVEPEHDLNPDDFEEEAE